MMRILMMLCMLALPVSVQAAEFKWLDDGNAMHSLKEYAGKPVILHLWASWCPPCRMEMPEVAAWAKAHPEARMVVVSLDRHTSDAATFLRQHGIAMPVLLSDPSQAFNVGARGLPATLMIGADGSVDMLKVGMQDWQNPAWSNKLLTYFHQDK